MMKQFENNLYLELNIRVKIKQQLNKSNNMKKQNTFTLTFIIIWISAIVTAISFTYQSTCKY